MRFPRLTHEQREKAEKLFAEYRLRPKNAGASIFALYGTAARVAIHGNPPNFRQRLGYRTAKRNRARKAAMLLYGDPAADNPQPGVLPDPKPKKAKRKPKPVDDTRTVARHMR